MSEKVGIVQLFGVHPGRDWHRDFESACPFCHNADEPHIVSRHPSAPFFWCAQCQKAWILQGADPVLDWRLGLPV